jgi:CelD/BcsL family acetyltransferase involved in cellulose biosynthesis
VHAGTRLHEGTRIPIMTPTSDGVVRPITVDCCDSLEELKGLQASWKSLLHRSTCDSAFVTWDWLSTWSERFLHGGRRLFVLVISEGHTPIAIAPLYVATIAHGPIPIREVGFLGLPEAGSDYLDVIIRKGKERVVARTLADALFGSLGSKWDTLALRDMPAESLFLAELIAALRASGKHYAVEESSFCPGVRLPRTFDEYLQELTSHSRQAFRRKLRRLDMLGVKHTVMTEKAEVAAGLRTLEQLHQTRWGVAHGDLFRLLRDYHERDRDGWRLELNFLDAGHRPVAGLLHFINGRKVYQYLMAVDRTFNKQLSVGSLLCGLSIQHAIEGGFHEYDFLKGQEQYKLRFMNRARRSLNIHLHNKTSRALSVWAITAASGFAKILVR